MRCKLSIAFQTISRVQLYSIIFLYFYVLAFAINTPFSIAVSYVLCLIYVASFREFINLRYSHKLILVLSVYMLLCIPIFSFNFGFTPLFYLISSLLILCAIKILGSLSLPQLGRCLAILYSLLLITVAFLTIKSGNIIEPFEGLIPGSSTNAIPSYAVVIQITYSVIYFLHTRKLPLYSSSFTVLISLIGLGRGAILISIVNLLLTILWNIAVIKSVRRKYLCIGFFLIAFSAIVSSDLAMRLINEWYATSKFSAGFYDQYRGEMVYDYLNKIDVNGLMVGLSYENTSIQTLYGNNPHNSFIRAHSFYGIVGFSIVVASLCSPFLSKYCISTKAILSFLMLLIFARAFTEPILFPTPLDLFYVLVCVAPYKYFDSRVKLT